MAATISNTIIIGDIGGTNARIQLRSLPDGNVLDTRVYPTRDFSGVPSIIDQFLTDSGAIPSIVCLAVCGPVVNNRAELLCFSPTWIADGQEISTTCSKRVSSEKHIPVYLLNDFVAVGYAVKSIDVSDPSIKPVVLPDTQVVDQDPTSRVCLGPGTGLGEVFVTAAGDIQASEGGMSQFVAHSQKEWDLIQYIKQRDSLRHVEVERIVSGTGIMNIYDFLCDGSPDPTITTAANVVERASSDKRCSEALAMFLSALGHEAGTLGLRYLPYGGVFIGGGGIAGKLSDQILDGRVAAAFKDKGHCTGILSSIPLYLMTDSDVGLRGCWVFAQGLEKDARIPN